MADYRFGGFLRPWVTSKPCSGLVLSAVFVGERATSSVRVPGRTTAVGLEGRRKSQNRSKRGRNPRGMSHHQENEGGGGGGVGGGNEGVCVGEAVAEGVKVSVGVGEEVTVGVAVSSGVNVGVSDTKARTPVRLRMSNAQAVAIV